MVNATAHEYITILLKSQFLDIQTINKNCLNKYNDRREVEV